MNFLLATQIKITHMYVHVSIAKTLNKNKAKQKFLQNPYVHTNICMYVCKFKIKKRIFH